MGYHLFTRFSKRVDDIQKTILIQLSIRTQQKLFQVTSKMHKGLVLEARSIGQSTKISRARLNILYYFRNA